METKHTPGPWKFTKEYHPELIGADKTRIIFKDDDGACGDPECCGGRSEWVAIRECDRPLIAAAPELLEALKEAVRALEHLHETEDLNTLPMARGFQKVIAKAEGRA